MAIEVEELPDVKPVIVDVDEALQAMLVQCVTRSAFAVELTDAISG